MTGQAARFHGFYLLIPTIGMQSADGKDSGPFMEPFWIRNGSQWFAMDSKRYPNRTPGGSKTALKRHLSGANGDQQLSPGPPPMPCNDLIPEKFVLICKIRILEFRAY
jgi:hypothetical protein